MKKLLVTTTHESINDSVEVDKKNIFVFLSTCGLRLIVFITDEVPQTQK